jgi:uncharacterized protein
MIKQLVEDVVKSLVEFPDLVEIIESQRDDGRKMIGIKISDRDLGKVIGRNGRTIKSIRALVYSFIPAGQEIIVDIAS